MLLLYVDDFFVYTKTFVKRVLHVQNFRAGWKNQVKGSNQKSAHSGISCQVSGTRGFPRRGRAWPWKIGSNFEIRSSPKSGVAHRLVVYGYLSSKIYTRYPKWRTYSMKCLRRTNPNAELRHINGFSRSMIDALRAPKFWRILIQRAKHGPHRCVRYRCVRSPYPKIWR